MQPENELPQISGYQLTATDVADILWLAAFLASPTEINPVLPTTIPQDIATASPAPDEISELNRPRTEPAAEIPTSAAPLYDASMANKAGNLDGWSGVGFKAPRAPALPEKTAVMRSLRPLQRRVPSTRHFRLHEAATSERIAAAVLGQGSWLPVHYPVPERWLDLVVLVDGAPAMELWQQTVEEFIALLANTGIFRNVQRWTLAVVEQEGAVNDERKTELHLYPAQAAPGDVYRPHRITELLDQRQRRLFLVISDCSSIVWDSGAVQAFLQPLAERNLVSLVQVLPEELWPRTALKLAKETRLTVTGPLSSNAELVGKGWSGVPLPLPVVTLEPASLRKWASFLAGQGHHSVVGYMLPQMTDVNIDVEQALQDLGITLQSSLEESSDTVKELYDRFRASVPQHARPLASYFAAAPLTLPVMRMIQATLLPQTTHADFARVFYSGIIQRQTAQTIDHVGHDVVYDFAGGDKMRKFLLTQLPRYSAEQVVQFVMEELSRYIKEHFEQLSGFDAIIAIRGTQGTYAVNPTVQHFAEVTTKVMRYLGGIYTEMADNLEQYILFEDFALSDWVTRNAASWDNKSSVSEDTEEPSILSHELNLPIVRGVYPDSPLAQLQDLIMTYYSLDEIKALCFELLIDYDDLSGIVKRNKVHNLLALCGDRQLYEQLIQLVIRDRPYLDNLTRPHIQAYYDALPIFSSAVQIPSPPPHLTPFIDRDEERKLIVFALQKFRNDVFALVGLSGVGKTALALKVSNDVASEFPGGVIWLSCTDSPTLEHLCHSIVEAYQASRGNDTVQTAIQLLKIYHPLLVMDDIDSNNPAVFQFIDEARRDATILLTTTDHGLISICKGSFTLTPLERQHAIALFLNTLEREVSETDMPLVDTLCELVGDLPLAVRLMAGYIFVYQMPLSEYVAILNESTLDQALEIGVRREKSVEVTFRGSFERLTNDARLALMSIALDEGESVTLSAFASGMDVPERIASQAGNELVRYSLAIRDEHGRYRLHPLVRRFAVERVTKQKARAIRQRLLTYYKTYVHEHNRESRQDYVALDRNRSNIWAILEYLGQTHNWALLIEVAFDLHYFMDVRGYWREGRKWLDQGLSSINEIYQGEERDRIQAKLQLLLGFMLYRLAEFQKAEQQLLASLALSRQLGDKELEQKNIYNLGFVYLEDEANTNKAYVAKHEKALNQFEASLFLAEQLKDPRATIMSKQQMGKCLAHLGRYSPAGNVLQECLTIYKNSGLDDERLPAFTHFYLGLNAHLQPGNERAALDEYQLALDLSRLVGDQLLTAETLTNIAEARYIVGDIHEAQEAFIEARGLTEKLQDSLLSTYQMDLIKQYPKLVK